MSTFKMQLVLTMLLVSLVAEFSVLACNIEAARQSSEAGLLGGWRNISVDDESVVQLKQSAVNNGSVARTHHVIEAYKQVGHKQASKQASLFATQSTQNNAKIYIKQADRLPERPKAINAGCPKLTDNTI